MRPALFFMLAATLSFGQAGNNQGTSPQTITDQRLQQMVLGDLEKRNFVTDQLEADHRRTAYEEQEFCRRANRVAELWSQVMADHYDRRVNVKKIHELSKAFHELEKSDGWLKEVK